MLRLVQLPHYLLYSYKKRVKKTKDLSIKLTPLSLIFHALLALAAEALGVLVGGEMLRSGIVMLFLGVVVAELALESLCFSSARRI